jgi:hypothetical protein
MPLTHFDQHMLEDENTDAFEEASFFLMDVQSKSLEKLPFVIFLNKKDSFQETLRGKKISLIQVSRAN